MRRFHLIYQEPGNQAAELVGQGVTFPDGTTVVAWSGVSVEISHQDPVAIALGEKVECVWIDGPPPPDAGSVLRPLRLLRQEQTHG